jgi:hypothetical protein
MGAHSQDKPARHEKSSHWYAFKLHKAAGCSTWRFLFRAQHMQREKLPHFLRSFLQAQEPVLAQIAAESPADEEVTLYILGPNKAPVGVCSQQWQVSRGPSRLPHSLVVTLCKSKVGVRDATGVLCPSPLAAAAAAVALHNTGHDRRQSQPGRAQQSRSPAAV